MFTHICPRIGYFLASKYRTSKGILHQNYTCKYQNHFLKVNMQSFAIISNVTCQSTIQCVTDTSLLFEEELKMFRKSAVLILHFAPSLHFTLSLHFTPGLQSAIYTDRLRSLEYLVWNAVWKGQSNQWWVLRGFSTIFIK